MSNKYYSLRKTCRSCEETNLQTIYAVPPIPVAGIYYPADNEMVNVLAPMTLVFCSTCGLVQLQETISPSIYRDYSFVGNSAISYQDHLKTVANSLVNEWGVRDKRVFEIGASNGVLLDLLAKLGANDVAGIEPSDKLCENAVSCGVPVVQGYFDREYLAQNNLGTFDCVLIRHVLEHIDDLNGMAESIRAILANNGLLVVEIPDVYAILQENLLSNVFHEHLNYFSRDSMEILLRRHGLAVIEQRRVDIHGGALLMFCRPSESVALDTALTKFSQLKLFSDRASNYYTALRELVLEQLRLGKKVHGFGASHRTFVLLGNAGLECSEIPIIYDSNPFLQNQRLNGLHSIILPKEVIMDDPPDALLIFATSYEKEITSYLVNECRYAGDIISLRYEALCGQ